MAYAALSDIQAVNPKRTYSATSTPTTTQVTAFLSDIAAELDTILTSRGVTVPVTAPAEFLAHLKHVNAVGAAARAEFAMFPEAQESPAGSPQGDRLWTQYQEYLRALRKDALPVTHESDLTPASFFTENAGSSCPEESYAWRDHPVRRGMEF
jgi:hypothetical protein